MNNPFPSSRSPTSIKLHEPTFGEEEIEAAVEVLRSTKVTQGEKVKALEDEFCRMFGYRHAVACNSGSSANLLAISALVSQGRLKAGDEVIVPALSWSTTVFPLIQHGLIPVFVDCDPLTLNIDVYEVELAISQKTKAIMPVHVYGNPCDSLYGFCDDDILLIEDCCESMGAEYHSGSQVGAGSDIATFSFYFSHHITTLEGGIVVTHEKKTADMLRIQRSHGWLREVDWNCPDEFDRRFCFVELGYNLRMTEVQAAIGIKQLPKLKSIVNRRRSAHEAYYRALKDIPYLRFQKENGRSSCFGFNMILEHAPFTAGEFRRHLEAHGVETRPIICGNMARQPVMKKYPHRVVGDLFNATEVMLNGLSIGCHQEITENEVDFIAETVKGFLKKAA